MAEQPKPTASDLLRPFHGSIAQWRAGGKTYREMASLLKQSAGLVIHFAALQRYCDQNNLKAEPPPKVPATRDKLPKPARKAPKPRKPVKQSAEASIPKEAEQPLKEALAAPVEPPVEDVWEEPAAHAEALPPLAENSASPANDPAPTVSEPVESLPADTPIQVQIDLVLSANKPPEQVIAFSAMNSVREQNATSFVHNDLSANKTGREQDAERAFVHDEQEFVRDKKAATPDEQAPAQGPPALPALSLTNDQLQEYLAKQMHALQSLLGDPRSFYQAVERLILWLGQALPQMPPIQQPLFEKAIAELSTIAASGKQKRSLFGRLKHWFTWNLDAVRWQSREIHLTTKMSGGQAQILPANALPDHSTSLQPDEWVNAVPNSGLSTPSPTSEGLPGSLHAAPTSSPGHLSGSESLPDPATASVTPPASSPHTSPPTPLFVPLPRHPVWTKDLELSSFNNGADRFTLANACEGVAIFGSTGSGKTTGSGQTLALSYLSAGFGGLVLTAKVDEADRWESYARMTGRSSQICRVKPGGNCRLNFLDYQARLPEDAGGSTEDAVEMLFAILRAYANTSRQQSNDEFWINTARELLRNLIRLFRLADQPLTLADVQQVLTDTPRKIKNLSPGPLLNRLLTFAKDRHSSGPGMVPYQQMADYWLNRLPGLNPRTRSIVVTHITSMIDLFFEPALHELFCTETTLPPEAVMDGAIVIVDLPIERHPAAGRLASILYKHLFQLVLPRRTDPDDASRRPVFLWMDEAQYFATPHDGLFQATARSASVATVCLTQNISNYYAQFNDHKHAVDGFFGNLNTKIFHTNNDPATNQWAADMIGKSIQRRSTHSTQQSSPQASGDWLKDLTQSLSGGGSSSSTSFAEHVDYQVQPAQFGKLRTGGIHPDHPQDNLQVDGIVVKSGSAFSTGKNFSLVTFFQESQL